MRGLDPRIQAHSDPPICPDGRVKPGHDAPYSARRHAAPSMLADHPMSSVVPKTEAEAVEIVSAARAARRPLGIEGGGTRAGLGRPVEAQTRLSTRGLTGITLYEPSELVISARAGTPLSEIEAALKKNNQALAFEPMAHRALYGTQGEPTIGGIAAGNISGPRRISAGAARDFLIGLRFVNGRGEIVKTGGRVMKNVTGLDLVKLLCGVTARSGSSPRRRSRSCRIRRSPRLWRFTVLRTAKRSRRSALRSAHRSLVSAAAHLPAGLASAGAAHIIPSRRPAGLGRWAPVGSAAHAGAVRMAQALAPDYASAWRAIRNVVLCTPPDAAIWRISVSRHARRRSSICYRSKSRRAHYDDWGGGLVWLSVAATGDAGAAAIRAALAQAGNGQAIGHATLVRAPDDVRARSMSSSRSPRPC